MGCGSDRKTKRRLCILRIMKMKTFNENFEIDRKSKGLKATAKHAPAIDAPPTADGTAYDANTAYYFFDEASREVRRSTGFSRNGDHLSAFGLKICEVSKLHKIRDAALTDGQTFFNSEIEALRDRIRKYESEKQPANRSLKAVPTSR